MARIKLTSGFTLIPEGTHDFKIVDVVYKEEFGKLEISMKTKNGCKHTERFSLLKSNGSPNEGAYNAFSFFAKTALQNFDLEDIDPAELKGRFITCEVVHDTVENRNKPGETITFAHLGNKSPCDGWEEAAPVTSKIDLKSVLG